MARLPRYVATGVTHHVVQRGNNRSAIFRGPEDYELFRLCLEESSGNLQVSLHAYTLMTNHVHLLVTPHSEAGLAAMMQSVGRRYVPYFNKRYARSGGLWEGRYRAFPVDTERYLFACMRYIELNPVRARIVRKPEAYRWSSYHANALGHPDPLVEMHPVFAQWGRSAADRRANYRTLCELQIPEEELARIRNVAQHGWALGDPEFVAWIEARSERPAEPCRRIRSTP